MKRSLFLKFEIEQRYFRYLLYTILHLSYMNRFNAALDSQPRWYILQENWAIWSGYLCLVTGTVFVVTSYLQLGFYGTFLGKLA